MITGGAAIYTVETVSDLLGVPRPTLYRYLKEYSIPYQRRSGKISIPDESIERIRRVRELHDEGLGTAAVRKRISEGDGAEVDWIAERLDQLSEALESSQRKGARSIENVSSNQALHIILARQSVMLGAIYNLTEMMEELLAANGRPRRDSTGYLADSATHVDNPEPTVLDTLLQQPSGIVPGHNIIPGPTLPQQPQSANFSQHSDRFGALSRKRRRVALVLTGITALILLFLAWTLFGSPL